MRFSFEFAATVPKDLTRPESNEDAWSVSPTGDCVVVSDGASESYDSRTWARLLADRYALNSEPSAEWLEGAVSEYLASIDFESLSWSRQAAFERGSFATLICAELAPDGRNVDVIAVGDSLAAHLRAGVLRSTFPFTEALEFDARPELLATVSHANAFLSTKGLFTQRSKNSWNVEEGDSIVLVTDAVGQWMLSERASASNPAALLDAVSNETEFRELIDRLRAERRIRLDDSTIVRVRVVRDSI